MSGRLTPLRFEILPPTSTSVVTAAGLHVRHLEPELAVVDEDRVARPERAQHLRVRQMHPLGVARRLVGVEGEGLALDQHGAIAPESADPELRPLQVDEDADGAAVAPLQLADGGHALAQAVARGVAHVDAEDVDAGLEQARHHLGGIRGGAEGGDDLGAS